MSFANLNFNPPPRVLREFAGAWLAVVGGLAAWQGLHHGRPNLGASLVILAIAVGVTGLIWPRVVRPVFVGASLLTFPIGWCVSTILLAAIYYLLFTPLALLFRLTGRDALQLKPRPELDSYWRPKPAPADLGSYFRQF